MMEIEEVPDGGPCPGHGKRGDLSECGMERECDQARRCFMLAHHSMHPCGWEYIKHPDGGMTFFRAGLIIDANGADNTPQAVPASIRTEILGEIKRRFGG